MRIFLGNMEMILGRLAATAATFLLGFGFMVVMTPGAQAQEAWYFDEFRTGAFMHDVESIDGDNDVDINGEILFKHLGERNGTGFLDFFLTPRPHLGTTVNFDGKTSEYYAGLTWDVPLGDIFFVEGFFGGAIHDGNLDRYGCRLNFHEGVSLGINFTEKWRLLGTLDHMSNANLCGGQSKNEGLTNAGLRIGYKFD